ncbi:hypothetical protein [Bacillus mycoides]|uniref:hypothetical protein n=1 Tax=Bacillus mycoides TaxID=1405 RepID=UPI001C02CF33|nr:hypothetical protein [Bacillus mycoides]NUC20449.1 hypothetical protein [Bacillus mycoides]QWG92891.1 hypothetical protein EXW40_27930 [Bacillus mycoides]
MMKKLINKYKVEKALYLLECKKGELVKGIQKGKYKFENDTRIIEFSNLLTLKLQNSYEVNGELTTFEIEVLDKAVRDGIHDISFYLLSQLKDDNKEEIIKELVSKDFQFLEDVGYMNINQRIPYIQIHNK